MIVRSLGDNARKREQRDQVREDHQSIKQIGQVPDELYFEEGTQHNAGHNDQGIDLDRILSCLLYTSDAADE